MQENCKLLGIYAAISALMMIQFPISLLQPAFSRQMSGLAMAATFVPSALLLVFAALLWQGTGRLSLISGSDGESLESASGITPAILQSIAFSTVGIFILIGTVSEIPHLVSEMALPSQRLWFWSSAVSILIRLALGLWLLLGAEGLRRLRAYLLDRIGPAFDRNW